MYIEEKNPNPTKDQHFMKDENILNDVYETAGIKDGELIVEIGGGEGALTDHLIKGNNYVTVIENDPFYASYLKDKYKDVPNVKVIEGDALDFDYTGYDRLVANLPYTITEPLLVNLAKQGVFNNSNKDYKNNSSLKSVTLILSQNSVRKLVAPVQIDHHENYEFGIMGAIGKAETDIDIVEAIPSSAFYPEPAVTSFLVNLTPKKTKTTVDRILTEMLTDKKDRKISIRKVYSQMLAQGKVYKVSKHKDHMNDIVSIKITSPIIENANIYDLNNSQISHLVQDLIRNDKNIKSKRFDRRMDERDYRVGRNITIDEDYFEEDYEEVIRPQRKYDSKYDYMYDATRYNALLIRGLENYSRDELQDLLKTGYKEEKTLKLG